MLKTCLHWLPIGSIALIRCRQTHLRTFEQLKIQVDVNLETYFQLPWQFISVFATYRLDIENTLDIHNISGRAKWSTSWNASGHFLSVYTMHFCFFLVLFLSPEANIFSYAFYFDADALACRFVQCVVVTREKIFFFFFVRNIFAFGRTALNWISVFSDKRIASHSTTLPATLSFNRKMCAFFVDVESCLMACVITFITLFSSAIIENQ